MGNKENNIKVFYAYNTKEQKEIKTQCENLLKQVISDIKGQDKEEFSFLTGKIKNADDIYEADFIIGDPAHPNFDYKHDKLEKPMNHPVPAIILLSDDTWGNEINEVLANPLYDVRGIFRNSKILINKDADEIGNFSEVIKILLRQFLRRNGLKEEDFSKLIDWKVKISDDCEMEFMSLFSTPAMQKMARKYKDAVLTLDDPFLKKFRENKGSKILENINESRKYLEKNLQCKKNSFHVPSLLLLGETGCGKTLLANMAAKAIMPDTELTKINISSYDSKSIDIMLFGAEKGSYTDSDRDRPGIFIGHCGEVVFLDEIGDMDIESQTHLLTYMDNAQVLPRGSLEAVCAPCILIAATNRDVKNDSIFRRDILNRFDFIIEIPSLNQRKQDLRLLISIILQDKKVNPFISEKRKIEKISLDAINYLEEHEYSGNFRELKFLITQAVNNAFSEGSSCLCIRHFFQ